MGVREPKVNRRYKDTLFRFLFGDESRKENALDLYNALNGSHYQDSKDLEITTINDALYMNMKNDVSFLLNSEMNLWEQQSSWNPNMPIRELIYMGGLYDRYIETNHLNIYSERQLTLPTPRCIVFYNGGRNDFERTMLRLSDSFPVAERSSIELITEVININDGQNEDLMKQCSVLNGYSEFVARVRINKFSGMDINEAVESAVDYCISNDILKDVLEAHKAEVIGMCITEYNEKETMNAFYAEGLEEGEQKGRQEGGNDTLYKLVQDSLLSVEDACKRTDPPTTPEQFLQNMERAGYKMSK